MPASQSRTLRPQIYLALDIDETLVTYTKVSWSCNIDPSWLDLCYYLKYIAESYDVEFDIALVSWRKMIDAVVDQVVLFFQEFLRIKIRNKPTLPVFNGSTYYVVNMAQIFNVRIGPARRFPEANPKLIEGNFYDPSQVTALIPVFLASTKIIFLENETLDDLNDRVLNRFSYIGIKGTKWTTQSSQDDDKIATSMVHKSSILDHIRNWHGPDCPKENIFMVDDSRKIQEEVRENGFPSFLATHFYKNKSEPEKRQALANLHLSIKERITKRIYAIGKQRLFTSILPHRNAIELPKRMNQKIVWLAINIEVLSPSHRRLNPHIDEGWLTLFKRLKREAENCNVDFRLALFHDGLLDETIDGVVISLQNFLCGETKKRIPFKLFDGKTYQITNGQKNFEIQIGYPRKGKAVEIIETERSMVPVYIPTDEPCPIAFKKTFRKSLENWGGGEQKNRVAIISHNRSVLFRDTTFRGREIKTIEQQKKIYIGLSHAIRNIRSLFKERGTIQAAASTNAVVQAAIDDAKSVQRRHG